MQSVWLRGGVLAHACERSRSNANITGAITSLPSAISGRTIRLFTPLPVSRLLSCIARDVEPPVPAHLNEAAAILVGIASRRGFGAIPDLMQSERLLRLLYLGSPIRDETDVLATTASVDPKAGHLRNQMVFSGAPVAVAASQVFAPHERVPDLFDDLVATLQRGRGVLDVAAFSAIVLFFCAHLHPFLDGNGRSMKVLLMRAVPAENFRKISALAFSSIFMKDLALDIWPRVRGGDLFSLVQIYRRFESLFVEATAENLKGVAIALERVKKGISAGSYLRLLQCLVVRGGLSRVDARDIMNISERSADRFFEHVSSAGMPFDNLGRLSLKAMEDEIESRLIAAGQIAIASSN